MAYGPCKNPDCPNHTLRVPTRNGFCEECAAAIREAKKKFQGGTNIPGAEPFEKIEELPDQDHFSQAGNMVPDLPEDLDRPFSLGGFDFEPAGPVRPVGKRSVSIRQDTVCFLAGTVQEHDLGRYTHARMTASKDGRAIAVKFYSAAREGANQLQNTDKAYRTLAAKTFLQGHPKFQGEKTVLEWMGVEGWFLMRFGGQEAA